MVVDGQDLAAPSTRAASPPCAVARSATCSSGYNLVPTLTAVENVMLPLELDGRAGPQGPQGGDRRARRMGHRRPLDRFPDDLTGGEQQRVAIARAIVGDRGLVLADEPSGSLDTVTGDLVIELLAGQASGALRSCS